MTAFVLASDVRDYLNLEGTTGKYADALLTSNIRVASSYLQKRTARQFENQPDTTKLFTTDGRAQLRIPDLRTATAVTLQGATLVTDASYWFVPDLNNSGIYVAVQFRPFGRGTSYLSNPEWFDRGLDLPLGYGTRGLPNDLSITGDWGWATYPDELLHATKVLAAWYTRRPSSLLANISVTPDGSTMNYGEMPPEVEAFIWEWRLETMAESFE